MVRDCSVQAAILKTEDFILEEREKIDNDLQHYSLEYCFEKYLKSYYQFKKSNVELPLKKNKYIEYNEQHVRKRLAEFKHVEMRNLMTLTIVKADHSSLGLSPVYNSTQKSQNLKKSCDALLRLEP